MKKRAVITGMGVISPIGTGQEQFWNSLAEGKSGIGRITLFEASSFSSQIAGEVKNFRAEDFMDKKKVRRMDRFAQFGFSAARMAVEDSKIDWTKEDPYRVAVITGSGIGGIGTLGQEDKVLLEKGPDRVSPFLVPMMISDISPGEIAIYYGLKGPNFATVSACASSAHAIGNAFRLIQYGEVDVAVSGGSEAAINPLGLVGFCSARALSTRNSEPEKASRPFDAQRDGFVPGEGGGMIILEELEHALKRKAFIYAELVGYGATDDAYHITSPNPDGESMAKAMVLAMRDAGIAVQEVDYINAHGTSTPLNDKTETTAIKKAFAELAPKVAISSTKSMTGHLLGAAGAVELIASILAIRKQILPPTINYEFPDPECDLDYVPNKSRPKLIKFALSNSFGFGGHNAVLALKKYE